MVSFVKDGKVVGAVSFNGSPLHSEEEEIDRQIREFVLPCQNRQCVEHAQRECENLDKLLDYLQKSARDESYPSTLTLKMQFATERVASLQDNPACDLLTKMRIGNKYLETFKLLSPFFERH